MLNAVSKLDDDMLRDRRITHYFRKIVAAETLEKKHEWRELMEEEINARSPKQVERLERAKGLR